ncbi:MAG: cobalt-precorrin-5B (C(1))-methyltransferase CbiD [Rikenellaceae bacterium]
MIIIFGGTTEGRVATQVCDRAAKEYIYSTKGSEQQLLASHAQRVYGAINCAQMMELFEKSNIKLTIDAAHPYAEELHQNIAQAAKNCNIPTIRFERFSQSIDYKNVKYFDSMSSVANYIKEAGVQNILALTGVKSASTFASIAKNNNLILRVMDRESSNLEIERSKFPEQNIVYYNLHSENREKEDIELCQKVNAKIVITKESGSNGGFDTKVDLAEKLNLQLYIVKRPALPSYTDTIYGEFGLRRAIEKLLPGFFELRTGFTTGSAATAAATAALKSIIQGKEVNNVQIYLPNGEPITIPTSQKYRDANYAEYRVIKDGGDDPDATNLMEIIAKVKFHPSETKEIKISGGQGIGKVTLPGVGIEVGQAAINPVPQKMIRENITKILEENNIKGSIDIEIEAPEGEKVGANSFNPRLGIIGGISILGTSGIVQPFSSEAFLESIQRQIKIVKALGYNKIVINSGAMSEKYVKSYNAELPAQCYIHYGNLIGATIELAASEGVENITIGCMIGKAVKLAKGALDTHSKSTTIDKDFILQLAEEASCCESTKEQIKEITTARQLWSVVPRGEYNLFDRIAQRCFEVCKPLFPNGSLELLLISENGKIITAVKG